MVYSANVSSSRAPNEEAQTSPFVLSEPFDLLVGGATG